MATTLIYFDINLKAPLKELCCQKINEECSLQRYLNWSADACQIRADAAQLARIHRLLRIFLQLYLLQTISCVTKTEVQA